MLPLIKNALEKESDAEVKALLVQARATIEIKNSDATVRRAAGETIGRDQGSPGETDSFNPVAEKFRRQLRRTRRRRARDAAQEAIRTIELSFIVPQLLGALFSGVSLGSVLLLAALGLAITFGLMGIINMAHGEMLMLGAYATYAVQTWFRAYLPDFVIGTWSPRCQPRFWFQRWSALSSSAR